MIYKPRAVEGNELKAYALIFLILNLPHFLLALIRDRGR